MANKKYYSLRVSILAIFLTTFILMMGFLLTLTSVNFSNSLTFVADKLINSTLKLVSKEFSLELSSAISSAKLSKELIGKNVIKSDDLINYTLYTAKNMPSVQHPKFPTSLAIWGDADGNEISAVLEPDSSYSTKVFGVNKESYELVRDNKDQIIKKSYIKSSRDVRQAPWYIDAKNTKDISWSDVYFSTDKNPTITLNVPIYDKDTKLKGVFALRLNLVRLSQFLSSLKMRSGVAFIFDNKGQLIAFPGIEKDLFLSQQFSPSSIKILQTLGKPWVAPAITKFLHTKEERFDYKYNFESYFAAFMPIAELKEVGWTIAVVVPEKSYTAALNRTNNIIMGFSLFILLLGILVMSYFSKRISDPIKSLVQETEKIKMLMLDSTVSVVSRIREVHLLAKAIYSMKMNLRAFEKYIPRKLVRQLIQTGEDTVKGGDERKLTIFFSDIKDFMTISESQKPQEFLIYLSDYLEKMTEVITSFGGTIDKYIGDSIMAFWGAPMVDANQAKHACLTALRCQKILDKANKRWEAEGKTPLITRIGIHTGTVLVGNIGSSERLNYTILGDAVNLTSRLDKINKLYHTKIIISEEVANEIGENFALRMVDRIRVRGKTIDHYIYELLAESKAELSFNLQSYNEAFARAFKAYEKQLWQAAIQEFKLCLEIYPKDSLAPIFIQRCQEFILIPPSQGWDGTWSDS